MKTNKLFTTLGIVSIVSAVIIAGCKKDETDSGKSNCNSSSNHVLATVPLVGASNFAILAGSAITSTGATNITGDLGLSPGSSIGGFPPGILVGTQHINDLIANTGKT